MNGAWIAAFSLLALAVFVLGVAVLGVMRRALAVLERAEAQLQVPAGPGGLTAGTTVPEFSVTDGTSAFFSHGELRSRRSIVLFLSPDCSPCESLARELRDAPPGDLRGARLIAVVEGTPEGRAFASSLSVQVVYEHGEVRRAFQTNSTPHAFAVDERGVVAAAFIVNTVAQLRNLVATVWGGGEPESDLESATERAVLTR